MERVVLTGAGAISPLGMNAAETRASMVAGKCAIHPIEIEDYKRLKYPLAASIKQYTPSEYFSKSDIALYDRFTQFALLAAREAVKHAHLTLTDEALLRAGVIIGTAGGGLETQNQTFKSVYEAQKNRAHPFTVPRLMANAASGKIAIDHSFKGVNFTLSTACASSNHAIGLAFHLLRTGLADVMLTGGAEAMLNFGGLKAWEGLHVMSPDGCRPFCKTRNGMVQGEGAGIFVLETARHAQARGADILAEICGFGMCSDAKDMIIPDKNGEARAIELALKDAQIPPQEIGYINAHGTGTKLNDKTETAAIHLAFKEAASHPFISSTKSQHGHIIGATGAIELLACLEVLETGRIPPTINCIAPDVECSLNHCFNESQRMPPPHYVMSNSFAFGGVNAVLILKQAQF